MNLVRRLGVGISLAVVGLGLASGCDDKNDDPDNLFVISITPADLQTNVNSNATVVIRFSTPVDPTSYSGNLQVILVDQVNSLVPISILPTSAQAASEFLTLTPATPLSANQTYGVAVREMVRATSGEAIQAPYAARFSTGASVASIPGFPPFLTPNPAPPNTGAPGTFTLTGQLNTARSRHTSTLLQSGDVLVAGGASPRRVNAGGTTLRSAEVYKRTQGVWITSQNLKGQGMSYARYGHTATLLNTGKVLIAGGWDERVVWDTAEIYDAQTDTFTPTNSKMARTRTLHTASLLNNGNILLTGGFMDTLQGGITATMEVYDVPSGTFNLCTATMNRQRCYHAATRLADGKIMMSGGIVPWFGPGPVATFTADVYEPEQGAAVGFKGILNPTGGMYEARAFHSATLYTDGNAQGLVIVLGGQNGGQSCEVYDPSIPIANGYKGDFALVAANMTASRRGHTANMILTGANKGKLLAVGGSPTGTTGQFMAPWGPPHVWTSSEGHNCGFCAATATAELFDAFGYATNLSAPWRGVDVTGRFDWTRNGSGLQTVMTGMPTNPVTPTHGRYYHQATTLMTGHVLVSGGWDCPFCFPPPGAPYWSGPERALGTCELYNP